MANVDKDLKDILTKIETRLTTSGSLIWEDNLTDQLKHLAQGVHRIADALERIANTHGTPEKT